jgi:D-alanyl-D-alanine dipeptidase
MKYAGFIVVMALLVSVAGLAGSAAPEAWRHGISQAGQALVVTTPDWNSVTGTLRRFERASGNWRQVGDRIAVVAGKNGLAWDATISSPTGIQGPVKHEGDGRSPAGVFPITEEFGFETAPISRGMKYFPLTGQSECVDDVQSHSYNEVVDRNRIAAPDWNSSEKMREVGGYRIGAVVGYNAARRKGDGSCIFLHVWSGPEHGTAGCTAMDEAGLRAILESLDRNKRPILIQMPEVAYERLRKTLRMP